MKEQLDRIQQMEEHLNALTSLVDELNQALDHYEDLDVRYKELVDYYGSDVWWQDLQADQTGEIPQDMPRGVLSEDGIYNLIASMVSLKKRIQELAQNEVGSL